ncbi:hypothetical protein ACFE04_004589 [Oxalis oulophora]
MRERGEGSSSGGLMDDYETLISTTDVELLKTAWRNEKGAPEILPYQNSLITRITEQIQLTEENVEEFAQVGVDPLVVSIYQMDLDRTQFLFRSYLRLRLLKIEKYMFHIIKTDYLWDRLSQNEKTYAKRCTDAMRVHLQSCVLTKLPDNYQSILKQSLISEEDDMVPKHELNFFVVGKGKRYLPPRIEPKDIQDRQTDDTRKSDDREFEVEKGDLFFARYKVIMDEVHKGDIELEKFMVSDWLRSVFPFWQQEKKLEKLIAEAEDAAKQSPFPETVIKRFELREHAVDSRGVTEFLLARTEGACDGNVDEPFGNPGISVKTAFAL